MKADSIPSSYRLYLEAETVQGPRYYNTATMTIYRMYFVY